MAYLPAFFMYSLRTANDYIFMYLFALLLILRVSWTFVLLVSTGFFTTIDPLPYSLRGKFQCYSHLKGDIASLSLSLAHVGLLPLLPLLPIAAPR